MAIFLAAIDALTEIIYGDVKIKPRLNAATEEVSKEEAAEVWNRPINREVLDQGLSSCCNEPKSTIENYSDEEICTKLHCAHMLSMTNKIEKLCTLSTDDHHKELMQICCSTQTKSVKYRSADMREKSTEELVSCFAEMCDEQFSDRKTAIIVGTDYRKIDAKLYKKNEWTGFRTSLEFRKKLIKYSYFRTDEIYYFAECEENELKEEKEHAPMFERIKPPSKSAIIKKLKDTVSNALPGDVILFYFFGHGYDNGDIKTLNDDLDKAAGFRTTPDELNAIIKNCSPFVNLTMIFNSCYSSCTCYYLEEPAIAISSVSTKTTSHQHTTTAINRVLTQFYKKIQIPTYKELLDETKSILKNKEKWVAPPDLVHNDPNSYFKNPLSKERTLKF
eukprot:201770_1